MIDLVTPTKNNSVIVFNRDYDRYNIEKSMIDIISRSICRLDSVTVCNSADKICLALDHSIY